VVETVLTRITQRRHECRVVLAAGRTPGEVLPRRRRRGAPVGKGRLGGVPRLRQWFMVSRLPAPRRIVDLLMRALSSYAHPDAVMVPWTPF
jgi:hypothetical protein